MIIAAVCGEIVSTLNQTAYMPSAENVAAPAASNINIQNMTDLLP